MEEKKDENLEEIQNVNTPLDKDIIQFSDPNKDHTGFLTPLRNQLK